MTVERQSLASLLFRLQRYRFTLLDVNDGAEIITLDGAPRTRRAAAVEAILAVGESHLRVKHGSEYCSLYIVLGNDPDELVCDHSYYEPLTQVVKAHSEQWSR